MFDYLQLLGLFKRLQLRATPILEQLAMTLWDENIGGNAATVDDAKEFVKMKFLKCGGVCSFRVSGICLPAAVW